MTASIYYHAYRVGQTQVPRRRGIGGADGSISSCSPVLRIAERPYYSDAARRLHRRSRLGDAVLAPDGLIIVLSRDRDLRRHPIRMDERFSRSVWFRHNPGRCASHETQGSEAVTGL